jgi:hypothetical protein
LETVTTQKQGQKTKAARVHCICLPILADSAEIRTVAEKARKQIAETRFGLVNRKKIGQIIIVYLYLLFSLLFIL